MWFKADNRSNGNELWKLGEYVQQRKCNKHYLQYGSVVVGVTYNATNLTGTEIFKNVGSNNCKSTVTVNLTVLASYRCYGY